MKTTFLRNTHLPEWQWVRETPVAILEENELPAWKDASQVIAAMRTMGATFLRYPAIGWGAHFCGTSSFLPKYPWLGERDLFREITEALRGNGMRIMAYFHYGVLYKFIEDLHPEWLALDEHGAPLVWNGIHRMACLCHDDFIEAMRNAIAEIAVRYRPDAVYLDGPTWYGRCYCDDCKRRYRESHAEEFPGTLSFDDGTMRKMNRVREKTIAAVLAGVRATLEQVHPCPLLFNTTMHVQSVYSTSVAERAVRHADGANTAEVHRPGSFWHMLESIKLGQGLGKASLGYLPPGPYDTLRTHASLEVPVLGAAYLMHGGTPMLQPVSSYLHDTTGGVVMRRFIERTAPHRAMYYRTVPAKELGLVYSRLSGQCAARGDMRRLNEPFSGFFQALLHGHRHFDCLYDSQLSREALRERRVLFLPWAPVLSAAQADLLAEFARNGGSLIVGPEFSLFDETGAERANFALADLLGLDFVGRQPDAPYLRREYRETGPRHGYSAVPEAYLRLVHEALRTRTRTQAHLVPVSDAVVGVPNLQRLIEYVRVRPRAGVDSLAELFLPAGGAFGAPLEFPLGRPPGIAVHRVGKGKVIYQAVPLGKVYLHRRLPEVREVIAALVDFALDDAPLLRMDAPSGVVANVVEDEGRRWVHLVNYCGAMFERGNPVEWIAPVFDIGISLRVDRPVRRIHTVYGERELTPTVSGRRITVRLPKLEVFETVCFE